MRRIITFLFCISFSFSALAQDLCSNATALCANNTVVSSTSGATASGTDPVLSCGDGIVNNSVWFTVFAINTGTATIQVSRIDNNPGLEMEIDSGGCGSLTPIGVCANANGPNGTMSVTFSTVAGTTYYIMVDGTNGNQEQFNIIATTTTDALISRPDAILDADPGSGCIPLSVLLHNSSTLHGGTNITYQWRIDNGPFIPTDGVTDTTVVFSTLGQHNVDLRVCNNECGCKTSNQEIVVQNLFPSIGLSSLTNCLNAPIDFTGNAVVLPDTPHVVPNVNAWTWNFGDPNSGVNNTASGQFATHSFVGPGTSFTVQLIADGTCGPDTVTRVVTLNPEPVVTAGPDQVICEGTTATLTATIISGAQPFQFYNWVGPGTIGCSNCSSTTVDDLLPVGSPYIFTLDIVDANGCTADTTVNIAVSPKPTVDAGSPQDACANQPVTLGATPLTGIPPFHYQWSPSAGLDNDTLQNPTATVNVTSNFCVTITDSLGCVSDGACVDVNIYLPPTIVSTIPVLCSTNPNLTDTFDVVGAGLNSTYSWILSPNYSLITGANSDSSSIYVTFPAGVAATYNFTAIVTDGVHGCIDTVFTSFSVTNGLNMSVGGPREICVGQTATLTATGAVTYAWTANPPYAFADSTQASQDVSPLVNTVFTIYGIAGTCTQTITDTLFVHPNPVAVVAPIVDFCGCKTVTLNGTGSTPGMTYSWTSLGGSIITSPSSLNTTSTICSSETFTLTVTDPATGCSQSNFVTVNESPDPAVVINIFPNIICPGVATLINLDGSGSDTAGATIHWSSNDPSVIIADTTSITTTATVSTQTVFYLTITSALGCDSTASDTVFIVPPPVLSANPPFLCASDPLQSTLSISGAGAGSSYSWDTIPGCATPTSSTSSSQPFDFSACGVGVYHFVVTVTDGVSGCVDTLSQNVSIVAGVTVNAGADTSICEGNSVTLTASGANNYLWSNSATTSSITLGSLTAAGSPYQFIVTGTIGSCTGKDTVVVTVNPTPITSPITGSTAVCANDTGSIYSVTPIIGNYTWLVASGVITTGQGTNSIHVSWGGAGAGIVSVFDTSASGCHGAVQTINVSINPTPTIPTINGPDTVCEGSTISYFVFPSAGSTYSWSATGGSIIGSPTGFFISVNWGVTGSGTVSVTETNAVLCSSPTQTKNIVINPTPVARTISGSTIICENSSASYTTPANPTSTFNWNVSGGTIASGQGTDSIVVDWNSAGAGSVIVQETNSFGCPGPPDTLDITINALPTGTTSPDSATICNGASITITGSVNAGIIRWITSGTGTFTDTTTASTTYNPGVDTGYVTLTMLVQNFPCPIFTSNVVLYLSNSPLVTVTATHDTICAGDNDTLTATGGVHYLWTPGTAADTLATFIVAPPSIAKYYVTVTNSSGCTTLDSITVQVNTAPIAFASPDSATVCNHSSFPVTGSANTGTIHWSTSGDGTFSDTTIASPIYNPGPNDTSYVTLTMIVSNPPCPNDTATVVLHYSSNPVVTVTATDTSLCMGTSDTLTATGGLHYSWSPATPADTLSTFIVSPSVNTTYTVTVTSGLSCITIDSIRITVDSIPVTSPVTGRDTVCEGDTGVVYTATSTPGNYLWSVTGGTISSGQGTDSIYVSWATPAAGTVTVTDTTAAGCSTTRSLNVAIIALPVTSPINGPDSVCENSTTSYSVISHGGSTYAWTVSGGSIVGSATGNFISITWSGTGIGNISVTESNSQGCPDTAQTLTVFVNPIPSAPFISGATFLCEGDTMQLYNTFATTGSTYNWNVAGGSIVSGQGLDSIWINWGTAGTDSVMLSETNSYGCTSDTTSLLVVLNIAPVATALPDTGSVCQGVAFQAFGSTNVGHVQWFTSGTGTFDNDTLLFPVYSPGVDTGYITLTMIASSPPCANDTADVVLYVAASPTVSLAATQNTICFGDVDTLSVTAVGTYLWSNGSTTATIIVSPQVTTTYYMTVTNNFSCNTTDSIKVNVIPPGTPNGGQDQLICIGDSAHLTGTVLNAGGLQWSTLGDGTFLPGTSALIVTYAPGPNDSLAGGTQLVVVSTGACYNLTDTVNISIGQIPTVYAGTDTLLTGGSSSGVTIQLNGVVMNATGHWTSTGTGTFSPDDNTLNAVYTPSTTDFDLDSVTLTLTTVGGCLTLSDQLVIVFSPFEIPNVITPYPESPGLNDFFVIKNLPAGTKLKIWDRWGLLVFESDNYLNDWDAAELKAETYYYLLSTGKKEYKGFIRVIREE